MRTSVIAALVGEVAVPPGVPIGATMGATDIRREPLAADCALGSAPPQATNTVPQTKVDTIRKNWRFSWGFMFISSGLSDVLFLGKTEAVRLRDSN
jgi:hypothetical protein